METVCHAVFCRNRETGHQLHTAHSAYLCLYRSCTCHTDIQQHDIAIPAQNVHRIYGPRIPYPGILFHYGMPDSGRQNRLEHIVRTWHHAHHRTD